MPKHDAFISYSRKDKAFAATLEKALEDYTPPKDLSVPQRHLDIFRDEEDFTGTEYHQSLGKHLRDSAKLIVLCSPDARISRYVNDEIRRFAEAKGRDNIIPLLVSGVPNNEAKPGREAESAFPDALCDDKAMPLAVRYLHFDPKKDEIQKGTFEGAWYTTLANIYGISRSDLEQRDKKRQMQERRVRRWRRVTISLSSFVILVTVIVTGFPFSMFKLPGHWRPGWNPEWPGKAAPTETAASWKLGEMETADGRFVGLALSGVGSRAMNFNAAVMLELQQLGLLEQVDVISSVSGGTLPAVYYGLGDNVGAFSEPAVREVFGVDFLSRWLRGWFIPFNHFRVLMSEYTRSDIFVDVLNDQLFHHATFSDLRVHPKLFISATLNNSDTRFTFTDETFQTLGSTLNTYELANAVYASLALPGVFDDVLLERHAEPPWYLHLSDGSATDAFGLQAIAEYLIRAVAGTSLDQLFPAGCLIIIVDSTPLSVNDDLSYRQSSKSFVDYFFNTNLITSLEQFIVRGGESTLESVGIGITHSTRETSGRALMPDRHQCSCEVLRIALRELVYTPQLREEDDALATRVTSIGGKLWISPKEQDDLFRAARLLVQDFHWHPRPTKCESDKESAQLKSRQYGSSEIP